MDDEAEAVPHSVAVAEYDAIRPERPGKIFDRIETEDVPEGPDDVVKDPTCTGEEEEDEEYYNDVDFMNLVKSTEDDGELMA